MSRPLPIYFIGAWFLLFFGSLPQHYDDSITQVISVDTFKMVLLVTFIASSVIAYRLIQCEKTAIHIVFWVLVTWICYLVMQFAWVATQYWDQSQFHPVRFTGLFIHLACAIYLGLPSTRERLVTVRTAIEKEQHRKFQLKQMNRP